MDLIEKKKESELIYKGKILDLYKDSVVLPDGGDAFREYIRHIGAACVVPVTDDGKVIAVKQFRYPFDTVLTEIPAGKLDASDEDPLEAAKRELREETGAAADNFVFLGEYYPTCAYSNERIYMYLATGLSFGDRDLDEDEFIDLEKIPLEDFCSDIMNGKIKDGKTQCAVLKAYFYLQNHQ